MADFIIAGGVLLAASGAICRYIRKRKQGGGCCGCSSSGSCQGCSHSLEAEGRKQKKRGI